VSNHPGFGASYWAREALTAFDAGGTGADLARVEAVLAKLIASVRLDEATACEHETHEAFGDDCTVVTRRVKLHRKALRGLR
jgi:hypothetical protein